MSPLRAHTCYQIQPCQRKTAPSNKELCKIFGTHIVGDTLILADWLGNCKSWELPPDALFPVPRNAGSPTLTHCPCTAWQVLWHRSSFRNLTISINWCFALRPHNIVSLLELSLFRCPMAALLSTLRMYCYQHRPKPRFRWCGWHLT